MDEGKLKKLEEKLYNETPFLGDRIKQQAFKELIETKDFSTIKILAEALVFHQNSKFGKQIYTALSQLKIQEKELINAVCQVWAEKRDSELSTLLKLKGWVASRPLHLRVLTALNLNWQGIITEKGVSVVKPLLSYLDDEQSWIKNTANEWSASFDTEELQAEVCRLATEENNQTALEVATKNGYIPTKPEQAALFYYLTQQWDEYRNTDSEYKLLEETYYTGSSNLQTRIDEHGQKLRRLEWLWMRFGGKEGRRLNQIKDDEWETFLQVLFQGQHWQLVWSLLPYFPLIWSQKIVSKLKTKRMVIKNPELKMQLGEFDQLWKKVSQKTPPQGKLVRLLHTLDEHSQSIESLVISADSQVLLSAGGEVINYWSLDQGSLIDTFKGHLKGVTSLCLNNDGSMLASGSRDQTISLWRLPEGNLIANLSRNNSSVWSLAMTDDLKVIASAGYREVRLWKYPPGTLDQVLEGHQREVQKLIISHDENLLISAGGSNDNTVRVYTLPDGEEKYTFKGHTKGIWDLVINPDDTIVASAGKDAQIKLWSLIDGQEITTLTGHQQPIWCLKISTDGNTLVSASEDKTVKVWCLQKNELKYDLTDNDSAIVSIDISHDSQLLATGSTDGIVKLWNLSNGELVNTLTGHQKSISVVKFSPNGNTLVSASADCTIKLWRWDLSRLAQIPLMTITTEDEQWLENAFADEKVTAEEKQWLELMQKLLSLKKENLLSQS